MGKDGVSADQVRETSRGKSGLRREWEEAGGPQRVTKSLQVRGMV